MIHGCRKTLRSASASVIVIYGPTLPLDQGTSFQPTSPGWVEMEPLLTLSTAGAKTFSRFKRLDQVLHITPTPMLCSDAKSYSGYNVKAV